MTDLRPEPLIFPEGVRFLRDDELPAEYEAERARIATAKITTGWTQKNFEGRPFSAYFEVNVHAPHLWQFVRDIAEAILPAAAAPIVGIKEEQPLFGPYTTRDAAISVFEPFVHLLQHDGFLEFGLIFQHAGRTEEVFVQSVKYVKIWTTQPAAVLSVLQKHRLPEVPDLQFIDNFPRLSESLKTPDGNARWPEAFEGLREAFTGLPAPPGATIH